MWEGSLKLTHFVKSFISLVLTDSHLFLFAFIWDMALIYIPVYNLESYEYFRRVFEEVLCHTFLRFAKVIYIFPYEIVQEYLLAWKVYYRIYYRISFYTVTRVLLDE